MQCIYTHVHENLACLRQREHIIRVISCCDIFARGSFLFFFISGFTFGENPIWFLINSMCAIFLEINLPNGDTAFFSKPSTLEILSRYSIFRQRQIRKSYMFYHFRQINWMIVILNFQSAIISNSVTIVIRVKQNSPKSISIFHIKINHSSSILFLLPQSSTHTYILFTFSWPSLKRKKLHVSRHIKRIF